MSTGNGSHAAIELQAWGNFPVKKRSVGMMGSYVRIKASCVRIGSVT